MEFKSMKLEKLIDVITEWVKKEHSGKISVHFHEGGIRKVKVEYEIN